MSRAAKGSINIRYLTDAVEFRENKKIISEM